MPGVQILPGGGPDPFAGQNAAAFVKIFQTLGSFETLRRKKMLNSDILGALQSGKDPQQIMQDIAGAVQRHQQPQFDTGLQGLFQKIAAPFAEAPGAGITDALTAQALKPQPRTEIQKLTGEGYTPDEAKMIRDISHGLKPRASTRQTYDNMIEIEKLDFLSKVKQRAEGQYYGVLRGEAEMIAATSGEPIRKIQPRDQRLLDWTLRELEKLPQYRQQGAGAFDPEGTGYDDDTAREAGLEPNEEGHWGSLDPRTGMVLKGRKHLGWDLMIKEEKRLGNKIVKRGNRYYSVGGVPEEIPEEVGGRRPTAKQPATGTIEARIEATIAAEDWDDALMWMHYGETPIPRGIATRAQQAGHSAESIVKAIQTFPDPTKITAETLDAALQGKTSKPDPLGIR